MMEAAPEWLNDENETDDQYYDHVIFNTMQDLKKTIAKVSKWSGKLEQALRVLKACRAEFQEELQPPPDFLWSKFEQDTIRSVLSMMEIGPGDQRRYFRYAIRAVTSAPGEILETSNEDWDWEEDDEDDDIEMSDEAEKAATATPPKSVRAPAPKRTQDQVNRDIKNLTALLDVACRPMTSAEVYQQYAAGNPKEKMTRKQVYLTLHRALEKNVHKADTELTVIQVPKDRYNELQDYFQLTLDEVMLETGGRDEGVYPLKWSPGYKTTQFWWTLGQYIPAESWLASQAQVHKVWKESEDV